MEENSRINKTQAVPVLYFIKTPGHSKSSTDFKILLKWLIKLMFSTNTIVINGILTRVLP